MLQWADTFNRYGTSTALMLNGLYADNGNTTLVADPDVTSTQKVASVGQGSLVSTFLRFPYPGGAAQTMGGAVQMWLSALPTNSQQRMGVSLSDISNTSQVCFRVLTTGAIEVAVGANGAGGGGTSLYTTTTPVVAPNSWNHIEWKVKVSSSTGTVELRINGAVKISLTGVNTQSSGVSSTAQVLFPNSQDSFNPISQIMYLKNFSVWDTTGTYNNNFIGTVQMTDIDTNADTTLTWTPSTGTVGWSILDNNPPVDTTYLSAATPLANIFGLGNLPADATSVKALVLINRSWKIDGGDGNVQMGIISAASTGLGTDRPITTAPTYWKDVIEVDPATGIPFTPTGFNAASLKQSRTV